MRGRLESLEAAESTSYKKGAESMRERAAKVLSQRMYDNMAVTHEVDRLFAAIRALPLKENEG